MDKLNIAVCIDLELVFYILLYSSYLTVLDDEDSNNITVGSLVTVLVKLTRQTMAVSSLFVLFIYICINL